MDEPSLFVQNIKTMRRLVLVRGIKTILFSLNCLFYPRHVAFYQHWVNILKKDLQRLDKVNVGHIGMISVDILQHAVKIQKHLFLYRKGFHERKYLLYKILYGVKTEF